MFHIVVADVQRITKNKARDRVHSIVCGAWSIHMYKFLHILDYQNAKLVGSIGHVGKLVLLIQHRNN